MAGLRREFPIDRIPCDDPRLDVGLAGGTIGEALDGTGPAGSLPVVQLVEAADATKTALTAIPAQTLEDALYGLAEAIPRSRHTHAVAKRLGWTAAADALTGKLPTGRGCRGKRSSS